MSNTDLCGKAISSVYYQKADIIILHRDDGLGRADFIYDLSCEKMVKGLVMAVDTQLYLEKISSNTPVLRGTNFKVLSGSLDYIPFKHQGRQRYFVVKFSPQKGKRNFPDWIEKKIYEDQ